MRIRDARPDELEDRHRQRGRAARALLQAAARGSTTLVIDMTRTWFCDTAGLHAMVGAHKQALAEGGRLRLAASSLTILRIFAITGIDRVIP